MLMQMAEEVNYMQQLTIFDVLDEMENESLRAEWEQDIYTLIQLRLEEMGLENYFDLSNTKIHLRTDAADKRLFVSLLSNVALLHDVQIYPACTELYDYFKSRIFSLADEKDCFKINGWKSERAVYLHCSFSERQYYDGFYYDSAELAKQHIEGVINTRFQIELAGITG